MVGFSIRSMAQIATAHFSDLGTDFQLSGKKSKKYLYFWKFYKVSQTWE